MKIYRVEYYNQSDSSQGFEYVSNKAEAEKLLNEFKKSQGDNFEVERSGIVMKEIAIGKYEFLKILNIWGSHPDNG